MLTQEKIFLLLKTNINICLKFGNTTENIFTFGNEAKHFILLVKSKTHFFAWESNTDIFSLVETNKMIFTAIVQNGTGAIFLNVSDSVSLFEKVGADSKEIFYK